MGELTYIIETFGAVDEAVVAAPDELLPKIIPLLPAYGRGAAGWYQAVHEWYLAMDDVRANEQRADEERAKRSGGAGAGEGESLARAEDRTSSETVEADTAPGPAERRRPDRGGIARALHALGELGDGPGDDLALRMLLAIAALKRVQADYEDVGPAAGATDAAMARALVPLTRHDGIAEPNVASQRSNALLQRLGDADRYPDLASFPTLLHDASKDGLLSAKVAAQEVIPCHWEIMHSPTSPGPALVFCTHHRVHGVSLDRIKQILDQARWITFNPPWCRMTPVVGVPPDRVHATSGVSTRYLERVADDCDLPMYHFETCLDFLYSNLPDGSGSVLEYRRSSDQRARGGDRAISVDEGSLVVRQAGAAIDLITTKRVQFRDLRDLTDLEAAMLAQFVWVLGYPYIAEMFINTILSGGGSVQTLQPVPGAGATSPAPSACLDGGAPVAGTVQLCGDGMRTSASKVASGRYGPSDYAADVSILFGHGQRYAAAWADFWCKTASGWSSKCAPSGKGSTTAPPQASGSKPKTAKGAS